jgi:uncharacterized repeat protein (TIGR01451 family)
MTHPRLAVIRILVVLLLGTLLAPAFPSARAQEADDLTVSLSANVKKARIGEFIAFTVQVENTGTETIPELTVVLITPDALDARAVVCPAGPSGTAVECRIGDLAPSAIAVVSFAVEVGSRIVNGPVTAWVLDSGFELLASAEVGPIRIVGPWKQR